jgi:hypothetical protein
VRFQLAVAALAARRFEEAALRFRALGRAPNSMRKLLYYEIYALCMAGRLEEEAARGAALGREGPDARFAGFVAETFDLRIPRG